MRNHLFIGAAIAALVAPAAVQAQETTSTIRGTVTQGGSPVVGATVTVVHVPSGSRSETSTDATGGFTMPGLRVGGPFTVSVNQTQAQITDIFTVIGAPFDLPIDLTELAGTSGEDIVVRASAVARAGSISQGPATILTAQQIATVASINRDIRDLSRRDPFARLNDTPGGGRAVSFAGQNARFNRFTVDGVPITDNFGLNPDALPTRRSPIPLDAIGQFQTRVAPFDVREGNFQGGVINAILKSGTNEFHGSGFYTYNSDELTGDRTKNLRVTQPNFKSENYGAQLSGPIIPDKLFFMIAGERVRSGRPLPEGPIDNNAGAPIPGLTQAIVDQVRSIAQQRFSYDTGGVLQNEDDKDDRLVARIDANIADDHRLALTYSYTKDEIKLNQNSFQTPPPGLGLESNGYVASNELHFGVLALNSDWSDTFSTEFRGFYKDYKRGQDPIFGRGFAQIRVCAAPTSDRQAAGGGGNNESTNCPAGVPIVSFGPDASRQTNALTSQTFGFLGQGRLQAGDHDIRLFFEYQDTDIFNSFLQRSAGDYYFDSLADLTAGNAQRLVYGNAVPTLVPEDAAANFNYQLYTIGMQDNWRVTDTFNLIYGYRVDMYSGSPRPTANPNFFNRYGFASNAYISGKYLIQPRLGFDWKPTSRIAIRGGAGVFGGGTPDVYVSNSFSNTGILTNSIDIRQNNNGTFTGVGLNAGNQAQVGASILQNINPAVIPGSANTLLSNAAVSTTSTTNSLSQNFKLPSQLRATLSADYTADLGFFGDEWRFGVDFLYSKVRNQVLFTDIRSIRNGLLTPDGRPRYRPATGNLNDTGTDILLTNTQRGRTLIGIARFDKSWDFGLNIYGSFTYQDVKDQAPATSSTAGSNYLNGAFSDPNIVQYGTANDEVKYQFKYGFTFDRAFFGDYKTRIALFGESRIGQPFSYTFTDPSGGRSSVFGTTGAGTTGTSGGRYLLYVPKVGGDPLVSYGDTTQTVGGVTTVVQTAAQAQAGLEGLINSTGLRRLQGRIAPRNGFNSKWFTKIDLHVEQEIPTFVGSSRITLFADIENLGNLINKDWGQIQEFAFPYTIPAVRVQCLTAPVANGTAPGAALAANANAPCAQYRYTSFTNPTPTVYSRQSLYAIRVGARFTF